MRVQTIYKGIFSLAAVALLSFGAVAAEGGRHHGGRGFERMAQHLSLTDAQQAQLKPIFEAQKAQRQQMHQQMKTQMQSILTPEQVAQLEQQRSEWQSKPKGERRAERGERRAERGERRARGERGGKFAKLNLTDAQKAQLKAFREAHRPQMQAQRQQFEQQMAAVLTAEQRAKVEEMKQRRGERRGNRT